MQRPLLLLLLFFSLCTCVRAQNSGAQGYTTINGEVFPYVIDDCGDTLIVAELGEMSVSSPQTFADDDEKKLYRRYRIYAQRAYPYAMDAIKTYRETVYITQNMSKRERKRYNKKLQDELKEKFEDPLKKMSKTQGKVLIAMIEKELDMPIYDVIKEMRGGITARYWATLGGLYGHKLKQQYTVGEDWILDLVLRDYDLSYEVE